ASGARRRLAAWLRAVSERSTTKPVPSWPAVSPDPGEKTLSLTGNGTAFDREVFAAAGEAAAASAISAIVASAINTRARRLLPFRFGERLTVARGGMSGLLFRFERGSLGFVQESIRRNPSNRFSTAVANRIDGIDVFT